jgi:hypothetical protein
MAQVAAAWDRTAFGQGLHHRAQAAVFVLVDVQGIGDEGQQLFGDQLVGVEAQPRQGIRDPLRMHHARR